MATDKASLPIVDFARLRNPNTKQEELKTLQHALFGIGFLYLINTEVAVSASEGIPRTCN
jgi:isopenicillin N synthase-like dioxygenase